MVTQTSQNDVCARRVFYPYGQTWRNLGNNWDLHFASMWQREFASGLDPTP